MFASPPKMVYDDKGQLVEVILSAEEYINYLRSVTKDVDWETLPPHAQDVVDRMLIDEVRSEKESGVSLDAILAGEA